MSVKQRKRPLVVLILISFLSLFFIYYIWQSYNQTLDAAENYTRRQTLHLVNYMKLGRTLLNAGMDADLRDRLDEAREARYIDFFIVQRGPEVVFFGNKDNHVDGIHRIYTMMDQIVYTDRVAFASTRIDDLTLTVGINLPEKRYWKSVFKNSIKLFFQDMIVIGLLIFAVVLYFLKDIMAVLEALRRDRRFSDIATKSQESELLVKGLAAYESEVHRLEEQSRLFGDQVLPSLKSELLSGRMPPYDFNCTLVRTDINGFSVLFNTRPTDEFLPIVNGFFEEVSHIVSRYGGYVHEFVGDEVIYYFKDEEHADSVLAAASAVRTIFAASQTLDERLRASHGYGFSVKSSLAHGRLRFGRQVNGFSLAGSILIETVRILSLISDKASNSLYFDESSVERLKEICELKFETEVELKGIPGTKKLWSYSGHKPLSRWFQDSMRLDLVRHYRSDEDIVEILKWITFAPETERGDHQCLELIRTLQEFRVTRARQDLKDAIAESLETLQKHATGPDTDASVRLAAICTALPSLLGRDPVGPRLEAILEVLLKSTDSHIVANVIEASARLNANLAADPAQDFSTGTHHRVLANALIRLGLGDLSPDVIQNVRQMIRSNDPLTVASGVYVIGELAHHHNRLDPIAFSTHIAFQRLLSEIDELQSHPHESVRNQAQAAKEKLAS